MDPWRYYEVTHSQHLLLNPTSPERIDELGRVLRLGERSRVLDVGCGHAEMLLRWHERHDCRGVGVDLSPFHFERAQERVRRASTGGAVEVLRGKGEEYTTDEPFDVACCVGASWIWKGHEGTLQALRGFVKPGGAIVTGEPYWKDEPSVEYLAIEGVERASFHDLDGCRRVALELGLELIWMAGSTDAEWDAYEMRQTAALDAWALEHPDDPDLPAIRERRRHHDEAYFRCGRSCLGWALWAFRVPE